MRHARRAFPLAIASLILCVQSAMPAERPMVAPYREYTREGAAIDWLSGRAEASGLTDVIWELNKKKEPRPEVRAKAEAAGRASLMELLGHLRVDSGSTLETMEGAMDGLSALLEEATTTSTTAQRGSKMSVTIAVPLWGEKGIISLLMPRIDAPDPQSTVTGLAPASRQGEAEAGAIAALDEEPVTGLVIDATTLSSPEPALFGRVIDDAGRVVHSVEEADFNAVRDHGLMAYAIKLYSGTPMFRPWIREGAEPLHAEAVALGDSGTDLIISSADADRVRKADADSHFLRECRVLVLMPPIGPIPGKKPQLPRKPLVKQENKPTGIQR